jgi:hypothetical protein
VLLTVQVFIAICSRARALSCCANRAAWLASIEIASKGVQRLEFELVKTVRCATVITPMTATDALLTIASAAASTTNNSLSMLRHMLCNQPAEQQQCIAAVTSAVTHADTECHHMQVIVTIAKQ